MECGYFHEEWPFMSFLSCFGRDNDGWTPEIFILTCEKSLLEILLEKDNTNIIDQISKNNFKCMVVYTVLACTCLR